jgi:2'-5' RNA ligase
VRLFIAVDPDADARRCLADRTSMLRKALGERSDVVRWTRAENIHVTLHFLGETDADRLDRLRQGLGDRADGGPFDVTTGRAGAFPARGRPRTLWLALATGADRLVTLHAALERRLTRAGFPVSDQPFTPHVTVGRVRDRERRRSSEIRGLFERIEADPIRWTVDRATMYASDLSGAAPRYRTVHTVRL